VWRNVTSAVDTVAELNNYLLPAWMIGFGTWLTIASRFEASTRGRGSTDLSKLGGVVADEPEKVGDDEALGG
jgi:hypothetical protein